MKKLSFHVFAEGSDMTLSDGMQSKTFAKYAVAQAFVMMGTGFCKSANSSALGLNKGLIYVSSASVSASAPAKSAAAILFIDGATVISVLPTPASAANGYYDLQGCCVLPPTHDIYIY